MLRILLMLVKAQKWGNSLAVRLPSAITRELKLREHAEMDIAVHDSEIVLKPVERKDIYSLEALLAGVTAENLHAEEEYGSPIGKEAL
jgi:antitoxin MazE